jgi:hypothetical protein
MADDVAIDALSVPGGQSMSRTKRIERISQVLDDIAHDEGRAVLMSSEQNNLRVRVYGTLNHALTVIDVTLEDQPDAENERREAEPERYNGDDPLYLSARMMELLQEERRGDPAKYAAIADKAARRAEAEHDWWRAREYWERKARWHELEGDDAARKDAIVASAETYVDNAKERLAGDRPDYLAAVTFYADAITAFRRIGGMQERCEQLHRELLVLQQKSVSTMGHFSASFEIPNAEELVEQARAHVRDKPLLDALTSLARVSTSPSVQSIQRSIEEVRKASPLFAIFPRVLVNQRGRTQKRVPDSSPDPDDARIALETDMFEYAVNTRRLIILTAVWPALDQVNRDHNIHMRDLAPLVVNNPFVPAGRESIFARGLYAGLTGDFLVASHLLIPQLEHAVRVLLESHGVTVSGIEDDGTQSERGLNTTLVRPEALEFFGEDLIFDLRGLLVEKAGSNLRHDITQHTLAEHLYCERSVTLGERVLSWMQSHMVS